MQHQGSYPLHLGFQGTVTQTGPHMEGTNQQADGGTGGKGYEEKEVRPFVRRFPGVTVGVQAENLGESVTRLMRSLPQELLAKGVRNAD